jgi:HK97 family phage major capsid protein
MRVWYDARDVLNTAVRENRGLTGEEQATYDRLDAELERLDKQRNEILRSDEAQREREIVNEQFRSVVGRQAADNTRGREEAEMRDFLSGRRANLTIDLRAASYLHNRYSEGATGYELFERERRGIYGDAGGGSLVLPSLVSSTIFSVMLGRNVMRQTDMTFLTTPTGDPMSIPVGSQGAATQIATQNTVIAGTDPSLTTKVLRAYDVGALVAVSNDIVTDAGVNILDWVASELAAEVATKEEAWFVSGDGSSKPTGIMNGGGVGAAGTIATGGSLLLGPAGAEMEKLIDVQFGVNSYYRTRGSWLVNDATAAKMRKIRDGAGGTAGQFVYVPSPSQGMIGGQPDQYLGRPIFTSSNVASMASDAKILAYGDFSYFVGRQVNGLDLQRSTDLYFDKNQVAVRAVSRVDSQLVDTTAVVTLHQAVS